MGGARCRAGGRRPRRPRAPRGRARRHADSRAVLHFAAHIWVGESVREPAKYYRNNVVNALGLFELAARHGVAACRVLVDRGGLRRAAGVPDRRDAAARADQSLWRLEDDGRAHARRTSPAPPGMRYVDPALFQRRRRRRRGADRRGHAATTAIWSRSPARPRSGMRPGMAINGTDYPTPDGTCVRDYIHVDDLAPGPSRRARLSRAGRRLDRAQLRLRPRLQRARGGRRRARG